MLVSKHCTGWHQYDVVHCSTLKLALNPSLYFVKHFYTVQSVQKCISLCGELYSRLNTTQPIEHTAKYTKVHCTAVCRGPVALTVLPG